MDDIIQADITRRIITDARIRKLLERLSNTATVVAQLRNTPGEAPADELHDLIAEWKDDIDETLTEVFKND